MAYVPPDVFGENYLYFYEAWLDDELSEGQAALLWQLLELTAASEVLDVPCGHGRIANRLAARGARVTGLDADAVFLGRARVDATERGVEVEYVEGDMRELRGRERFDAAVNWFTSFGYFDDEGDRTWLEAVRRTLKPGGGSRSTSTAGMPSCATGSRPRSSTRRRPPRRPAQLRRRSGRE